MNQTQINLKGILVGNGCTDWDVDATPAMMEFLYMHNVMSIDDFKQWKDNNCYWPVEELYDPPTDPKCIEIWKTMEENIQGLNIYDIYRHEHKDWWQEKETIQTPRGP